MSAEQTPTVHLSSGEWQPEWFLGGHVVLDFVNTVPWRLDPARVIERLPDAAALIQWAHASELIGTQQRDELCAEAEADAALARTVATQARELRELLYGLLQPVTIGETPDDTEVDEVRRAVTDALGNAEIATVVPLHLVVPVRAVRDLPRALALSAWRLLQFDDLTRLRQCHDAGCGWLFMDRTKNASRVWCSSSDCGNRTRARRHYQRQRGASSPGLAKPSRAQAGDQR